MKIAIGCDHVGFILKDTVINHLKERGITIVDKGTYDESRTDYPIYGRAVAEAVSKGDVDLGIVFCGTGVGISITANKVKGVRSVVCSEPYSAKLSREHNNTNVLSFGSRVVGSELAKMIIDNWLDAKFEGGRHSVRIEMISDMEGEK